MTAPTSECAAGRSQWRVASLIALVLAIIAVGALLAAEAYLFGLAEFAGTDRRLIAAAESARSIGVAGLTPLAIGVAALMLGYVLRQRLGRRQLSGQVLSMSIVGLSIALLANAAVGQVRMIGIERFEVRSERLLTAIAAHRSRVGSVPESLGFLVPEELPGVPLTGFPSESHYFYSRGVERRGRTVPWKLSVHLPLPTFRTHSGLGALVLTHDAASPHWSVEQAHLMACFGPP